MLFFTEGIVIGHVKFVEALLTFFLLVLPFALILLELTLHLWGILYRLEWGRLNGTSSLTNLLFTLMSVYYCLLLVFFQGLLRNLVGDSLD